MIDGVERVMPGDNTTITGELLTQVALEKGARFAIRGRDRTLGAGSGFEFPGPPTRTLATSG